MVFLVEKLVFNLEIVKGLSDKICVLLNPTLYRGLDDLSHLFPITRIYWWWSYWVLVFIWSLWVEPLENSFTFLWPYPSCFKRLQNQTWNEGGCPGPPEQQKEIAFLIGRQPKLLWVCPVSSWEYPDERDLKHHHIKWLEGVGRMRRKDKQQNLVLVAVFNEIQSNMRSMTIYNKEAPPSSSFLLSVAVKHLFRGSWTAMNLVLFGLDILDPGWLNVAIRALENEAMRKNIPTSPNTS